MVLFDKKDEAKGDAIGETDSAALSRRGPSALSRKERAWTVRAVEEALLEEFPATDAEAWDRTGLVVGEGAVAVSKVALALDPTVAAIEEAASLGANVLVTHHPPFLTPPDSFAPEKSTALNPGAGVWAALRAGVALMCFHTALDVSPRAARVLPGMLGLDFTGQVVEPSPTAAPKGYGQLCLVESSDDEALSLGVLAARCTAVFGRQPRVWGDFDASMRRVVTATGSLGSVGRAALAARADCVVCGEVKYHEALELAAAGLGIIELGHDASELPLVALLAQSLLASGLGEDRLLVIDQSENWRYPEAIRL